MKKLSLLLFFLIPSLLKAQTLYVPSGTSGIGSSSNGNVGIGTQSPEFKLDVMGNFRATSFISAREYITVDNGGSYRVALNAQSDGYVTGRNNANQDKFLIAASGNSYFNGGNVGIGTTTPQTKFHIVGGRLTQEGSIANDNNAVFVNSDATGYGIYSRGGLSNHYAFHFENQVGNSILYGRGDGNVGIGTVYPDAKLAVNGTIHTKEVKVDLTGWPDYVFNDDYKLLSLEEIKIYIDKNKHLPEVPSAKEMEANGVQLGEMNMLLLKKIEELTLHLIEQNKIITKQNERIESLENKK